MDTEKSIRIMKALADASRMNLLRCLLDKPGYVEELAERQGLSASTVSFHLKKLQAAGLVRPHREQYYTVYEADPEALAMSLATLIGNGPLNVRADDHRQEAYRLRLLKSCVEDGRVNRLPMQQKKRRVVLEAFTRAFTWGRTYPEQEVNRIITRYYDDYCLVRRELVDFGYMTRDAGVYRLAQPPTAGPTFDELENTNQTAMEKQSRRELIRAYKMTRSIAGIYQIRNLETGRVLIGSATNVNARMVRHKADLAAGAHRSSALQEDWNRLGSSGFVFEIKEEVAWKEAEGFDVDFELKLLEKQWTNRMEIGNPDLYNTSIRIRNFPF